MIDRYEIGERQTSACGIPTGWLEALGPDGLASARRSASWSSTRRTAPSRWTLPWTFSTFDYRELCGCSRPGRREFETAKVDGRTGHTVHTDRGDLTAPLIVDALGWRRMLAPTAASSRPTRRSRAASRSTPTAPARTWRSGSTASTCPPATAGASPPTTSCGSASAPSTRASTSRTPPCCSPRTSSADAVRYQGNWIPHKLRAGDRGRHLLRRRLGRALPAADRRGHPHRLLLRHRLRPRAARRGRGAPDARAGAAHATARSTTRTSGSSAGCCGPRSWCRGSRRGCCARVIRACGTSASSTGPSGTTCEIAPPGVRGASAPSRAGASPAPPLAQTRRLDLDVLLRVVADHEPEHVSRRIPERLPCFPVDCPAGFFFSPFVSETQYLSPPFPGRGHLLRSMLGNRHREMLCLEIPLSAK